MTINEALLDKVTHKYPQGTNIAKVLMDILCIGKEAAYRRLRGDTVISLEEAARISQTLGLSLDNLIGTKATNKALFELNILDSSDPLTTYRSILEQYKKAYNNIKEYNNTEFQTAANLMPQSYYLYFDHISKFRLFKWIYNNNNNSKIKKLSDLIIPDDIRTLRKEYVFSAKHVKETTYIFDHLIFSYIVNDIKYFSYINLINKDELKLLKEDLIFMLDKLEEDTANGHFSTGNKLNIYVSDVNIEASYGYLTTPLFNVAMIRLYSINAIMSTNPEVFKYNKNWIQSVKKYSTMISESAETQRIKFFNKQRDIVNEL
jgi:hypothetical protein